MATAKLTKAFTVPVDIKLWTKPEGERAHQDWWRFVPGKEYEIPEGDTLLRKEMQEHKTKKRYDAALEAKLKELGITPEIELCKVCGGKKKFLTYPTLEIRDE